MSYSLNPEKGLCRVVVVVVVVVGVTAHLKLLGLGFRDQWRLKIKEGWNMRWKVGVHRRFQKVCNKGAPTITNNFCISSFYNCSLSYPPSPYQLFGPYTSLSQLLSTFLNVQDLIVVVWGVP